MKTRARKTEDVMGKRLRVNDVVIRGGYEWVIDRIAFEPDFPRYCCTCHWSGNGPDPQFFNNNFDTAQRDGIPWMRVVNPKPRRLVCRTDAPAWYATQVAAYEKGLIPYIPADRPSQPGAAHLRVRPPPDSNA
jgi:hypothetical protein